MADNQQRASQEGTKSDAGAVDEVERSAWLSARLVRWCHLRERVGALKALAEGADPNAFLSVVDIPRLESFQMPTPHGFIIGRSPLMAAARSSDAIIALDLLLAGADPNLCDAHGQTALSFAAASGSVETIRALLMAGASAKVVDKNGDGALACAAYAREANPDAVALLLEHDASWGGVDEEGEREAKSDHESWDPSGQWKWSLDERVRALLLAAKERELLKKELSPQSARAPKAL